MTWEMTVTMDVINEMKILTIVEMKSVLDVIYRIVEMRMNRTTM